MSMGIQDEALILILCLGISFHSILIKNHIFKEIFFKKNRARTGTLSFGGIFSKIF